jgi:hypothetical protein
MERYSRDTPINSAGKHYFASGCSVGCLFRGFVFVFTYPNPHRAHRNIEEHGRRRGTREDPEYHQQYKQKEREREEIYLLLFYSTVSYTLK